MKFMKLGTKPDTFCSQGATRAVTSDVSSDLTIRINSTDFLLHKVVLLPKCGLLQRLCCDPGDACSTMLELHDIPGGEDAFELCAKFCYGITVSLGAPNFVLAFCAAKFLQMTESVERANFVLKLEAFFTSCILEGWKDTILTLETTGKLVEWSEHLEITRRCMDSIVEKILLPPAKVTWSYTYTRPGHHEKHHTSVPRDWWTEDISGLDIDMFGCVITAARTANILPPQLIGEALHVYASRWLLDDTKMRRLAGSSVSLPEEYKEKNRRVLENIVRLIPDDPGSVSVGFLIRLLRKANLLGAPPVTKAELLRRAGRQFEEATLDDLLFPSHSPSSRHFYDIDSIGAVLDSFLIQWKRQKPPTENALVSITKVGKLIDSYIQVIARDVNMPVTKIVHLVEALPNVARPEHDDLYQAINTYLKEHPDVTKAEKKRLCRVLDCQKLSSEVCAHVVKNERLPLRTVVQVLFFEQERERGSRLGIHKLPSPGKDQEGKSRVGSEETSSTSTQGGGSRSSPTSIGNPDLDDRQKIMTAGEKLQSRLGSNMVRREMGELALADHANKKTVQYGKRRPERHQSSRGRDR